METTFETLVDILTNSMEFYSVEDLCFTLADSEMTKEQIEIIYNSYYKLSAKERCFNTDAQWIEWIQKVIA